MLDVRFTFSATLEDFDKAAATSTGERILRHMLGYDRVVINWSDLTGEGCIIGFTPIEWLHDENHYEPLEEDTARLDQDDLAYFWNEYYM